MHDCHVREYFVLLSALQGLLADYLQSIANYVGED